MDRDQEIEALIGPEATQDLRNAVADGEYASTEDALRAAVDGWSLQRFEQQPWVREAIEEGLADVAAGRVSEVTPDFWDDIRQRARQRIQARQSSDQ